MKDHPKNNYAFEIRFVDDKTVQVFDIAAKNKQEGNGIPTEYDQDEVLRGQLRYSKLLGSTPSSSNKLGDLNDDGRPYEHKVVTKRSKNRRSIQRQTFFMMGGGYGGGGGGNEDEGNYYLDSEDVKPTFTDYNKVDVVSQQVPTSPPSPTPSIIISTPSSPVIANSPTIPSTPQPALLSSSKHTSIVVDHVINYDEVNKKIQTYQPNININQVSPIITSLTTPAVASEQKSVNIPFHSEPQQPPKHQYYTEDYTSIVMIDSNDYDSKRHIQRQESRGSLKKSASSSCCIIS